MKFVPICTACGLPLLAFDENGQPMAEGMRCSKHGFYSQESVDNQYKAVRAELAKRWAAPTVKTEQQGLWGKGK